MKYFFLLTAMLLVTGCVSVTPSVVSYEPPTQHTVQNSTITPIEFNQVWDTMVGKLSETFFVINNIDKESRLLNISFTASDAKLYADCGRSRWVGTYNGTTNYESYQTADDAQYELYGKWGPYRNFPAVSQVNRRTDLEGRTNIYIAPVSGGTEVRVNSIYVWKVTTSGIIQGYDELGRLRTTETIPSRSSTVNFTTNNPGGDLSEIVCTSTGKLEETILQTVPK